MSKWKGGRDCEWMEWMASLQGSGDEYPQWWGETEETVATKGEDYTEVEMWLLEFISIIL